MYTITKEKQYYYLTNEEENKKYSLNINTKEIKNEKTNRILKNFPNIKLSNAADDTAIKNNIIIRIIATYKKKSLNIMFSLLEFWEKMTSFWISQKRDINNIDTSSFIWKTSYYLDTIEIINNNFSNFVKFLKNNNHPEDICDSIKKYSYYLEWNNYKDLISFTDFCILHNSIYPLSNVNIEFNIFILKTLKKGKFLPFADEPNYLFLRIYCEMLKDYWNNCVSLNKKPCRENNMLREINETAESYAILKREVNKEKFKTNYKKHSKAWNFNYSDFIVTIPIEPKDLVIEGEKMHHCVGSYVDRVINNETYIVFIRRKNDIKTPYITAEVDLNGNLQQYYLACDRKITEKTDIEFKEKFQEYLSKVWDLG